ncbi:MAG: hypothetical protein RL518_2303 [Pseudomonadota bacterium]|jgi:hypothetical protein
MVIGAEWPREWTKGKAREDRDAREEQRQAQRNEDIATDVGRLLGLLNRGEESELTPHIEKLALSLAGYTAPERLMIGERHFPAELKLAAIELKEACRKHAVPEDVQFAAEKFFVCCSKHIKNFREIIDARLETSNAS